MWSFKFKEFEVIDKKNISSKFLANKKISTLSKFTTLFQFE